MPDFPPGVSKFFLTYPIPQALSGSWACSQHAIAILKCATIATACHYDQQSVTVGGQAQ